MPFILDKGEFLRTKKRHVRDRKAEAVKKRESSASAYLLGLSATSQQYFSLGTNQPPATSQQYFSLRTNQHQPSATSQTNRL
jgi:hypothetical protein